VTLFVGCHFLISCEAPNQRNKTTSVEEQEIKSDSISFFLIENYLNQIQESEKQIKYLKNTCNVSVVKYSSHYTNKLESFSEYEFFTNHFNLISSILKDSMPVYLDSVQMSQRFKEFFHTDSAKRNCHLAFSDFLFDSTYSKALCESSMLFFSDQTDRIKSGHSGILLFNLDSIEWKIEEIIIEYY
jgi:transposase-like protein